MDPERDREPSSERMPGWLVTRAHAWSNAGPALAPGILNNLADRSKRLITADDEVHLATSGSSNDHIGALQRDCCAYSPRTLPR